MTIFLEHENYIYYDFDRYDNRLENFPLSFEFIISFTNIKHVSSKNIYFFISESNASKNKWYKNEIFIKECKRTFYPKIKTIIQYSVFKILNYLSY